MKPLQFKVTNKEEYDDLMRTIEKEYPNVRWVFGGEKPTQWSLLKLAPHIFDNDHVYINVDEAGQISWNVDNTGKHPDLKLVFGQPLPKTALEELISINQNQDGSITISPELQAKLVIALRGGEK